MTGMDVVEVNVSVGDVHLPEDENDTATESRVS